MRGKRAALALILTLVIVAPLSLHTHIASADQDQCMSATHLIAPPPAGFVPAQATDAQLKCYGLPARPSDREGLAHWQDQMSKATHYVYPRMTHIPPGETVPPLNARSAHVQRSRSVIGTYTTNNWTGYDTSHSLNPQYTAFTDVSSQFVAPVTNVPYPYWIGPWVGTGDGTNPQSLIQAGTASWAGAAYFWWENFPDAINFVSNFPISQGQRVTVEVQTTGVQNGITNYYFGNMSNGKWTSIGAATPHVDVSAADFILEEHVPTYGHFNTFNFEYGRALAQGCGCYTGPANANTRKWVMRESGTNRLIAYPSDPPTPSDPNYAFYTTFSVFSAI